MWTSSPTTSAVVRHMPCRGGILPPVCYVMLCHGCVSGTDGTMWASNSAVVRTCPVGVATCRPFFMQKCRTMRNTTDAQCAPLQRYLTPTLKPTGQSNSPLDMQNPTCFWQVGFCVLCWLRHIFPGRLQPSIVCAGELNFCVRKGNRWTLTAIETN